jgi:hypothetical protein
MKTEWMCERCGIPVICCVPMPAETMYCLACRFIESIDGPKAKAEAEEFFRKQE